MKVIKCGRCIDGTGTPALENAVVVIEESKIVEVGEEGEVDIPRGIDVEEIDCSGMTVLPGLIDSHVHLALGAGDYYEEMFSNSDAHQLICGVINARSILDAGITTVKDCGARNRVAFDLREASERGLIETPRLLLSGRSITMTGGHFYFCNAVADGYEEVRKTARGLLKEGADFIKVMASGGGTQGTDPGRPSYSVEELKGAVEVAHRAGKTVSVHCHATEAIINAIEAEVDVIEHCSFLESDGKRLRHRFREDVAQEIAKKGIYVDHVLPVFAQDIERLKWGFENLEGLREQGVKILAGSDDLFLDWMGSLPLTLELMVRGGMSPMEAIQTATSRAAKAMKAEERIGTLEKGKEADLIAVEGNPLEDMKALVSVRMVMKGGRVIQPSPRQKAKFNISQYSREIRTKLDKLEIGLKRRK